MMNKLQRERLILLGSGGFGSVVADIALQLGYEIVQLDDADKDHSLDSFARYVGDGVSFIPAFGSNAFRLEWIDRLTDAGAEIATLIHPTAYVSPKASIAEGVVILPHAVVNTDVTIERGCIINLGAMVDHGCVVEEGVHICLGAIVKAENRVTALSKIEAGEVIEARVWPVR